MIAPTIYLKNACLTYKKQTLFHDLNLTLEGGLWTSLLGQSGIGKSSLLRLIAGLNTQDSHADITASNNILVKDHISYMAQTDLLFPWLTALDNVLIETRLTSQTTPDKKDQAFELLKLVGLENHANAYPKELSGGMRQRVALARTLIQNKPIVLMDEPFSALDAMTRFHLQNLAVELLLNKTVFFVTHDPMEALRLANNIYVMTGKPATLDRPIQLGGTTPRELSNLEIREYEALLFAKLSQHKGYSYE